MRAYEPPCENSDCFESLDMIALRKTDHQGVDETLPKTSNLYARAPLWLSTHNDKNSRSVSKSSPQNADPFSEGVQVASASFASLGLVTLPCPLQNMRRCRVAWHPAVHQVIVRLRGGGPNLCLYLTSHALSEWQDIEQPTAMGKKIRASTAEHFLGSI